MRQEEALLAPDATLVKAAPRWLSGYAASVRPTRFLAIPLRGKRSGHTRGCESMASVIFHDGKNGEEGREEKGERRKKQAKP